MKSFFKQSLLATIFLSFFTVGFGADNSGPLKIDVNISTVICDFLISTSTRNENGEKILDDIWVGSRVVNIKNDVEAKDFLLVSSHSDEGFDYRPDSDQFDNEWINIIREQFPSPVAATLTIAKDDKNYWTKFSLNTLKKGKDGKDIYQPLSSFKMKANDSYPKEFSSSLPSEYHVSGPEASWDTANVLCEDLNSTK